MVNKKRVENEFKELNSINEITNAYAFISALFMRKVRESVLRNRDFLDSIYEIFNEVLYSYRKEVIELAKKRGGGKGLTFLAHNGRTVSVFLSSNTRLYGDVITRTFQSFLDEIRNNDYEATIIGRYGLVLFQQSEQGRPYTFFDFPDSGTDARKLSDIISHLVQYEEIHLHYPKFENVISQKPSVFKMAAGSTIQSKNVPFQYKSYLFEPSLEDILTFFETEIFTSVFEQTIRESQLAKNAARILAMDTAQEKIKKRIKNVNLQMLQVSHKISNQKQMQSFLGMSLWKLK